MICYERFTFVSSKIEGYANLKQSVISQVNIMKGLKFTYLSNGNKVRDQMMALMPPITSSFEGTGPSEGQIPFKTYNGDVPMSE